jgi:tetratricopeptide (TPR) repeat protein
MSASFPGYRIDPLLAGRNLVKASRLISVFVVFFVIHGVAAQDANQAQDHASFGLSLARERKFVEAERELREAVRIAPAVALHRAQLGSILGLQEKWDEALESFQKAVDLDPADINFRRETAAVQWQLRQMPAAEMNLRYVLAKRPADPGATLLLGLVSEANGEYLKASRLLHSQFDLVISQPDRTVAMFHSDARSGQRANISQVVEALKTRANDPAWADAISRCTQIVALAGDLETSELLYSLTAQNQPSAVAAGLELAKLRYNRGQVEAAQKLLLQLSSSATENPNLRTLLGHCYEALQHRELALQAYQQALELDPSQPERYEDLILLQLELGRTSEATSLADRLLATAPRDAKSWVLKADVELRTNSIPEALKSYTHASHLDLANADAALGIAAIHALSGLNDAAMANYKTGIRQFPNDPRFYVGSAAALLASPQAPQAYSQIKSLLLQAVKLDPHSADAHYQLGQLALKQGELDVAKDDFFASLQIDPHRSNTHFALSLVYRRLGRSEDAAREFATYEGLKPREDPETAMSGPASRNR